MEIALHVNVDHVATLRQARGTPYPDPVEAALLCERAGADGVTVHLREDRRHIQPRDVRVLREVVRGTFNLECAATEAMVAFACELRPDQVTLVPERREERTTEGGLDAQGQRGVLEPVVARLRGVGIRVSLFIAGDPAQVDAAAQLGAEQVELHTGDYANARGDAAVARELDALFQGAGRAHAQGLRVAAGHGLTTRNVPAVAALPHVVELNIGHAVISEAVLVGLPEAVHCLREAIARGYRSRRP
ncbi:MAG: pyridoxine 5'-phosphate synthase [Deltaproteobacteria bacterium]|nr:pyridoxine 5'-phosphate synthase [Deltaproteobacteria bacterium]